MKLKLKGSFKDKLLGLVFLIIAASITFYIYTDAQKTRETMKVPVLNKDIIDIGRQIKQEDITWIEIGKYKLGNDIVQTDTELVDKYVIKPIYKSRYIYKSDLSSSKPQVDIKEKIKYGAIAVETDLAKCVGGIPSAGDYVKAVIIKENTQDISRSLEVIQYPELNKIKILEIQNISGTNLDKSREKQESEAFATSSNESKPAIVVFDAMVEQEKKLLEGQYAGKIHLVLLPMSMQTDDDIVPKSNTQSKEENSTNLEQKEDAADKEEKTEEQKEPETKNNENAVKQEQTNNNSTKQTNSNVSQRTSSTSHTPQPEKKSTELEILPIN